MDGDRLLAISSFGRAVGLPASALRHYAEAGVLEPAEVDPSSGYRYYAPAQLRHGVLVARLRAAGVPLRTVRQALSLPAERAAVLLEQLASERAEESEVRLGILRGIVADLRAAADDARSGTVRLCGPVLARALEQVLQTSRTAAPEVAGVVWALTEAGLAVAATDRYWLAHHTLTATASGGPVSAFTGVGDTGSAARALARQPFATVTVTTAGVHLRTPDDAVIAELDGGERAVPDLGLLVARQPPRRALAGFARGPLLQLLGELEPAGPTDLRIVGEVAHLGPAGTELVGWASSTAPQPLHLLVRPSLLSAAVRACVGDDVLVGVAGGGEPLVVTSPDQPHLTSLVMPMRP
ncbi:MerR family transcriptional regulator [Desertihabitans aurantiacus]|uniref:MerR family transcriptional regulator n=1 Tax=Desertihabitans aurantiacus TaxID=2282477 RepID=UPI000DF7D875|nr:MerR family transcriptional regulator [Desertihabitans aurantiacus]